MRAATASSLSGALGVSPFRDSARIAVLTTSSATLDREMPKVAPFSTARENANSSAAARVAAMMTSGGSIAAARARASARRAAADGNTIDLKVFIRPTGSHVENTSPVCQPGSLTRLKQVFYTYV